MASITTINSTDAVKDSRATINTNFSNLNTDKQEKPAEGAFADGDKTKLDGIETAATADQTGAEIKIAYEAEADTNAFTDADHSKLDGIEASADVTDATNVAAAGAPIITSGAGAPVSTPSAVGDIYVDTTNDNVYAAAGTASSADWKQATGAGGGDLLAANNLSDLANAATSRTNLGVAIGSDVQAHSAVLDATTASFTTADETKLDGIETAATADQTGAEIKTAYEAEADTNAFTDADHTKLDGIEASADVTDTTNVTAAGALMDSEVDADIKTLSLPANTTISTFGASVIDDADAAAARTTLGAGTMSNLSEDTTPQLGGELDSQANSIGFTMQTATGDGATTVDWGNGNHMDFTFGAFNETFTFTAPAKPGVYTMSLKQDSVGSRTATWPATVKWPAGTAPTLTTTATTGYDLVAFRYDGTNYYGVATLNFS